MHKTEKKNGSTIVTMEVIVLLFCIVIIGIGIIIDVYGCVLFEINQEQLNGICNTIVGIQATVFSIIISLLSLFSCFVDKEKYGIPVLRYLIKYRHRYLNQYKILLIELCLLVFSTVLLFFGYNNTLFCCFIVSLGLICILASESFMLYRLEDIDKEMFTFLKANINDKQLKLFDNYIDAEERRIALNDHPCESRVWELWQYEIEVYSDNLENEEYSKIHYALIPIVLKYLENSNKSVQQYGIDCILKVLDEYYSHRKTEQKKNIWGNPKSDISTELAKEAFREWMVALADMAYTEESIRFSVDKIVPIMHKFENNYSIYTKQTIINNFFDVLIIESRKYTTGDIRLKSFLHYILVSIMNEKDYSVKKLYLSYAIHFSLLIIERGYPEIVEEELFEKFIYRFKDLEYKIYFGVNICFFYYIAFIASDDEIKYFSLNNLNRDDIKNILKNNNREIMNCFKLCSVSGEYCKELKQYLRSYEFLIPNKGGKVMCMDSVVEKFLIFFMMLSSPSNISTRLRELVDDDWYRIYITVVNNAYSREQYNELAALMSSSTNYKELEDAVEDISRSVVIDDKKSITEEEEAEFKKRISCFLSEFTPKISIGKVNKSETVKFSINRDVRHLVLKNPIYDDECCSYIRQNIFNQLGKILIKKLKCNEVNDHISAKEYLEKSKSCDFRFGNRRIPLYDNNRSLRKNIQDRISDEYNVSLDHNGFPVIFYIYSERVGIHVDTELTVRKLTEEEKLEICNCTGDKYRQQVVNDIYFDFSKKEYFKYVDNEYRMLEIKCSMEVSVEPDAGTYTLFKINC